ncbi:pyridoxal-phosphate dependent enzyme [Mesorhizobium sp. ZMM04-5]|uniref:Pyridoxal-phosphate dependent enzyme n=1 Tax=Mesorhizobium marinum TaxID=3228790 RepID=A0ABV3QX93_9HYPH
MTDFGHSRFALLDGPTPLRRMERLEATLGRRPLYIKRDDHMEAGLGGNKLRSLEFWVGAALEEEADVLVVAGEPNSNQCRLTAAAAAKAGLDCVIVHNAHQDDWAGRASALSRILGATIRFVGPMDENRRSNVVEDVAEQLRLDGRRPYVVGNGVVGALGYARAAAELLRQSDETGAGIRHVFLPGSMGPTETGFIFGNALLGNPFEVHLVSVEYGLADLAARIARIDRDLRRTTGLNPPPLEDAAIHYHMDYLGPGYARPTPQAEEAILALARHEAIFLEHTYTGKTFACFMDMAKGGALPADEAMCFLHTGGVPALFWQLDLFNLIRQPDSGRTEALLPAV